MRVRLRNRKKVEINIEKWETCKNSEEGLSIKRIPYLKIKDAHECDNGSKVIFPLTDHAKFHKASYEPVAVWA